MLFITDIKFMSEKSTFHHWLKSSGFCDLNHSIEAWFLAAYPGQTKKLSWILSPTSAKNFIDKKNCWGTRNVDGNKLRLDLWSFLILISPSQEKYSLMTKARFKLRKAITSVSSKKLRYLLVFKCCHGKVPFQRYHNDKTKYFRSFHKVYFKHSHLCSRCLVSPLNALSPSLRDLIKQGLWRLLKTLFNGKENSHSLVKLNK